MSSFAPMFAGQTVGLASMGFGGQNNDPTKFAGPLAAAGAGLGAGLALISAIGTNRALRNTAKNAANAASFDLQSIVDAATVERLRATQQFRTIAGGITASAAERGLTGGGSIEDLLLVNTNNAATERQIISINEQTRARQRRAQFDATIAQLRSQQQFAPLSAVLGGLQGFQAGSALGTGIDQLRQ